MRYGSSVHAIRAVIGKAATLEAVRAALPSARIIDLPQGLALLPAVPAVITEAGAGEKVSGFYGLTSSMRHVLERASAHGPLVYVETEYFGPGGQAALLISEGRTQSLESTLEDEECGDDPTPISTALREIGVARRDALDEFDAIGLGRHRSTEKWYENAR